jgi:hypothetical protein
VLAVRLIRRSTKLAKAVGDVVRGHVRRRGRVGQGDAVRLATGRSSVDGGELLDLILVERAAIDDPGLGCFLGCPEGDRERFALGGQKQVHAPVAVLLTERRDHRGTDAADSVVEARAYCIDFSLE